LGILDCYGQIKHTWAKKSKQKQPAGKNILDRFFIFLAYKLGINYHAFLLIFNRYKL